MNREELARQFSAQRTSRWKTFVVEAHPDDASCIDCLADVFHDARVETTDDEHLHTVIVDEELSFTVDDENARFWSFHSIAPMKLVTSEMRRRVTRRWDLDFVWLPSHHLRQVRPGVEPAYVKTDFKGLTDEIDDPLVIALRGRDAAAILDSLRKMDRYGHALVVDRLTVPVETNLGYVEETVDRFATFMARGNSFALHQQIVSGVVNRYLLLVEAAEKRAIRFTAHGDQESGGRVDGSPIEIRFSRRLHDVPSFLDQLFSSREPFRLWGLHVATDAYGDCDGVDLHVGERIRVEVQPEFLRIHLYEGGCGNTVARLVANLQHHVDGALEFDDPELNDLLTLRTLTATARQPTST